MCPPVMAAAAIAQSVVSFAAASADYQAKAAQWKENYVNSITAMQGEQKQIQLRMMQEESGLSQKVQQARIEGAEIKAEAEVSAASAGVSGISLSNIVAGIGRKVDTRIGADRTNYLNTAAQLKQELKATRTTAQNRINSVQKPVGPNPLGYALQGIGGALQAAA